MQAHNASMKRSWVRSVVRGLVGVLLFAQLAIASYACPGLAAAVAATGGRVETGASTMTVAAQMTGCSDMGMVSGSADAMDPAFANLCAEHCKYGQQSDQAATLTVPVALLMPLYTVAAMAEPALAPPQAAAATADARVAATPPHSLLHCVFRL